MIIYKSAESVSTGHPDSYMDYVVNSILDEYLKQDPNSRVAIDGVVKNKYITLGGEITSQANISDQDIENIIKRCTKEIGYDFDPIITLHIYQQSPDIALGTNSEVGGAGDQGTITGYASTGINNIPTEKFLADELIRRMFINVRPKYNFIKSDMKSQVTLKYVISDDGSESHCYIDKVVFACQHTEETNKEELEQIIIDTFIEICKEVDAPMEAFENTQYIINGTGQFILGGPEADSGEVGRKIVVDAYGVSVPVGGGTYNGKDPSKVDRSAAYYARYAAKNIVEADLAEECLITVSYCIGLPEPMSIDYEFFCTNKVPEDKLIEACNKIFNFTPNNIIKELDLKRPIYATSGLISHFGLETKTGLDNSIVTVPWEQLNKVDKLRAELNSYLNTEEEK